MISSIVVVIGVEICDDIGIEFIEEVNIVVLTVLDDNDVENKVCHVEGSVVKSVLLSMGEVENSIGNGESIGIGAEMVVLSICIV